MCMFDVVLQVPITATPGSYINTTSDLTSGGLSMRAPITATLVIEPPPVFDKKLYARYHVRRSDQHAVFYA